MNIFGVDFQNIDTPLQIRLIYNNASVKTSRTKKRLIENLWTVRCCQYEESLRCIKSVHLSQKLVQRLLTLIVSAAVPAVTALADRIDLINKGNTRCILLSLFKQITHT